MKIEKLKTKMNKRNIFTMFGLLAVIGIIALSLSGGYSSRSNYIINTSDIEDGDTLLSGWYEIGGSDNVGVTFEVSDSVTARVDFFYKF